MNIQASLKSEGSGDGKYDLADKEVEVSRVWAFGVLVSMLDTMSSLSTMKAPSECSKGVGDENGHSNSSGNLEMQTENSSWLLAVITSRWVNQRQFPHKTVGNQEALEPRAPVSQPVNLV